MELRDFFHFKRIKIKDFAKKINISQGYLSHITNGYHKPSEKMARLIEKETNGEVTFEELMSINPSSPYAKKTHKQIVEELKAEIEHLKNALNSKK